MKRSYRNKAMINPNICSIGEYSHKQNKMKKLMKTTDELAMPILWKNVIEYKDKITSIWNSLWMQWYHLFLHFPIQMCIINCLFEQKNNKAIYIKTRRSFISIEMNIICFFLIFFNDLIQIWTTIVTIYRESVMK